MLHVRRMLKCYERDGSACFSTLARSQLAIMDFNKGSNLEQATTERAKKRYNVQFSKIQKAGLGNQSKTKKAEVIFIAWQKKPLNA